MMRGYDAWKLTSPDDEREPVICPYFRKPCPHDGEDCDEVCSREADAEQDKADWGDWRFHRDHDQ